MEGNVVSLEHFTFSNTNNLGFFKHYFLKYVYLLLMCKSERKPDIILIFFIFTRFQLHLASLSC